MRAVVVTAPGETSLREVPPPVAGAGEVLVDVTTISVNRGELHRIRSANPGWRPGWDFAGTVAGGAGFARGDRVFGVSVQGGAWADQVAVPANHVARLPAGLDDDVAAALPVAGLTAQRVLRLAGDLADRRVLVTGAAGGVGRFAVQLAAAAGADVTAARVVTSVPFEQYDVILDSVGGPSLSAALHVVAPGGTVVTFGNSARVPEAVVPAAFYPKQAVLRGYYLLDDLVSHPPRDDLTTLAVLAGNGGLRVDLDAMHDIEVLPRVLHALAERRVAGKAVLRMRPRIATHGNDLTIP